MTKTDEEFRRLDDARTRFIENLVTMAIQPSFNEFRNECLEKVGGAAARLVEGVASLGEHDAKLVDQSKAIREVRDEQVRASGQMVAFQQAQDRQAAELRSGLEKSDQLLEDAAGIARAMEQQRLDSQARSDQVIAKLEALAGAVQETRNGIAVDRDLLERKLRHLTVGAYVLLALAILTVLLVVLVGKGGL